MKKALLLLSFLLVIFCPFTMSANVSKKFEPNWESLDSRPLPPWFDDAKIGIFIHWGVFSVPGISSEWMWSHWMNDKQQQVVDFIAKNYPPGFTYQDFAPQFKAELFSPDSWAELLSAAGAKYVVLTSKHHEGFTLWPSKTAFSWNSVDVGPKRDLVGDLSAAVRKQNLTFGLYHSKYEWFNPLYLQDKANNYQTDDFVTRKTLPELYDIVNTYKPDVLWSDGDWEVKDTYWKSMDFLAWLYNDSPVKNTVVTNDRWGQGNYCKHGDFINCADRYRPGKIQHKKWENCMTIDKSSWGYMRTSKLSGYMTDRELLEEVVETVAFGGNILINVGPTADGRIDVIFEERLLTLGSWLKVNGEAIYATNVWKTAQNDSLTPNVFYTANKNDKDIYAIFFHWPVNDKLPLYSFAGVTSLGEITLMKNKQHLTYSLQPDKLVVDLSPVSRADSHDTAFALKITLG